jgi:hypothetical protein
MRVEVCELAHLCTGHVPRSFDADTACNKEYNENDDHGYHGASSANVDFTFCDYMRYLSAIRTGICIHELGCWVEGKEWRGPRW